MSKEFNLFESGKVTFFVDIDQGGTNPAYMMVKFPDTKNGAHYNADLAFKIAVKCWHKIFNDNKPCSEDYFLTVSRLRDMDGCSHNINFSSYKEYTDFINNNAIDTKNKCWIYSYSPPFGWQDASTFKPEKNDKMEKA